MLIVMQDDVRRLVALARSQVRVPRRVWVLVAGFLGIYLSWQALRWVPGTPEALPDAWFLPVGAAGVAFAFAAARRTRRSAALRAAWCLVGCAWTAYLAGLSVEEAYRLSGGTVPVPAVCDVFYLAFYPLAFAGLLRFPARRSVRSYGLLFALDLALVSLGVTGLAWYLVISPYIVHDGHTFVQTLVAVSYPVGDGLLVVGLVSRVLRGTSPESRTSLGLLWGGVAFFVSGDLLWEHLAIHGAYRDGSSVDILWMLAQALVLLAACVQRPATGSQEDPRPAGGQAAWLPYLGVALGLGVLLAAESSQPFFGHLSVALIATALIALLIARQRVTHRTQRDVERQIGLVATLGRHGLHSADLDAFLAEGAACVAAELRVERCAVLRLEAEQHRLRMVAGAGWPRELIGQLTIPLSPQTHAGYTMLTDAPVVIGDLRADARFPSVVALREAGIVSGASTPIQMHDGRFGLLAVHTTRPRRFSTEEITFLDSVAGVLGAAAERSAGDERVRQHALYDFLTGLPNRVLFDDRLEHALSAAHRHGRPLALLFIDLDHFKNINDSLGHGAGDEVLRRITERLAAHLRGDDTLARFGGDEFAVLLPEVTGLATARAVAARLLDALRSPLVLADGRPLAIGASIGIALHDADTEASPEVLKRNADLAMYAAKNAGRGKVRAFEPSMHETAMRRLELSGELRDGVDRGEFELYYQPIVSLGADGIAGVEALIRWNHPTKGLLYPGAFIELAEETAQIVAMGRFVLREACAQLGRWRRDLELPDGFTVAVNVSATQLQSPDLLADVRAALQEAHLRPDSLILEITESVLIHGNGIKAKLEALHRLGVRLAVDDFGTGYSSLGYLHRYPFDILKIDKSFIDGLGATLAGDQLVQGIISLARCLELRTIAEGVETARQARVLRAMSAGLAQGFHFGEPVPAAELVPLLAPAAARRSITPAKPVRLAEGLLAEPLFDASPSSG